MSVNRTRKIQEVMRFTEEEHAIFLQRVQDSGIQNKQAYLRKMALTGYVLRIDMSEVRETLRLIANANSNINQVAKRANETRSIYAADMIQLREEVGDLRSQMTEIMKVFGKVREFLTL